MHLGNGAITPECGLVALGVAAAGAGIAVASARGLGLDRARSRTAGALGAAVFAAQLLNVQILPFSSVHLIGGVLLAWVLGPALGCLTIAAVLALQALVLGDGGLLALGANVVNMAMVPALAVAGLRRVAPVAGSAAQTAIRLGLTAFAATVAGAGLIVLEVVAGRRPAQLQGIDQFAAWMLGTHALAGVVEGLVTVAAAALLIGLQPRCQREFDLFSPGLSTAGAGIIAAVGLAIALFVSLGLASSQPDGYQAALAAVGQSGHALARIEAADQFVGLNATVQAWQDSTVSALAAPETVLLVGATFLAGAATWLVASQCGRTAWRPVQVAA